MAELIDLGNMGGISDEDIAVRIGDHMNGSGRRLEDYLYRGMVTSGEKINAILEKGTDRSYESWDAQSRAFQQASFEENIHMDLDEARYYTDPGSVFAVPWGSVDEAIGSADLGKGIPVVAVYRSQDLVFEGNDSKRDRYKFLVDPKGTLEVLYKFEF